MAQPMTMLEKILAKHSKYYVVQPGKIIDIEIDVRVARDFGGANVVKNLKDRELSLDDPGRTFFTFDCNPTGSDQRYAVNQHICRLYARDNGIKVYDINAGIGTHILIDEGLVYPGATAVSTDSHANIVGAVGAFGQGMGDIDVASTWNKGKIWFKVPHSVKINFIGKLQTDVSAKDFVLNLLNIFGASTLLGLSVELCGKVIDNMSLDERITISSMATEMGAIVILFPPSEEIIAYAASRTRSNFTPVFADTNAHYENIFNIDTEGFKPMVSLPGEPHNTVEVSEVHGQKIDSAFIGSCTNGRISDMRIAAAILKNRKVAPGVILKIVPSTDSVWNNSLNEGLINIFKNSGALISNAGCAGCAEGQVGQNGPGEVTVSTGNRNFPGKQGKGSVFLASPAVVAASAIAGIITSPGNIPDIPVEFEIRNTNNSLKIKHKHQEPSATRPEIIEGKIWLIKQDNIDTDMIYHNRYLTIYEVSEMGRYTFANLKGYEDFASKAAKGDIVIAGKNFGSGSSRQQAVDCFKSLGISAIVAKSFGAIYERNAINAALPVIAAENLTHLELENHDSIRINLMSGEILNLRNRKTIKAIPFSDVQSEIYQKGGLL